MSAPPANLKIESKTMTVPHIIFERRLRSFSLGPEEVHYEPAAVLHSGQAPSAASR
jgi:hypothetical protein